MERHSGALIRAAKLKIKLARRRNEPIEPWLQRMAVGEPLTAADRLEAKSYFARRLRE